MDKNEEINRIGYYSVIPSTILYNKRLKPNERLLYACITSLSNKEGFCYASNKYLGGLMEANEDTISKWVNHLKREGFVYVQILRNEKKEVLQRRIYPNDVPYRINKLHPLRTKEQEGIDQNAEDNNINNNNISTHTVYKKQYAEKVFLYEHEYQMLVEEYGENKANKCIEELSLYKKSKGKEYPSDYATIKRWVIYRVNELENKSTNNKSKKSLFEYEQRQYPPEFFESLYDNIPSKSLDNFEDDMDMEI